MQREHTISVSEMDGSMEVHEMHREHTASITEMDETMDVQNLIFQFLEEFQENPRLVKTMAEICLNFRRNDMRLAAESLNSYLDWRRQTFGDLSDQSLADDKKLQEQLWSNFIHLSPVRLSSGAGMIYLSMKNHNPAIYSTADTIKCMHFFMITAMMQDTTLAANGFVILNNMTDVDIFNLDMNFPAAVSAAVGRSVPVRLLKIVLVNPPMLVRFIVPILKTILPAKLVERLHVVSEVEELPDLIDLPCTVCLPVDLGGVVEFDTLQLVDRCMQQKWVV